MNLVLLDHIDLTSDGLACLRGAKARHILDVHRVAIGDTLKIGLIGGPVGQGVVIALSSDEVRLAVRLSEPPPAPLGIDLLLAMPRPKMFRRLVAAVASIGVKRLVLVNSARVEKSYFDSSLVSAAAIDEQLRLGLAQACDTILPEVKIKRRFRPFVEDEAGALWPDRVRRLVAHPRADRELWEVLPASANDTTVLAIGPEGGWVPFELELLEARGFRRFAAGPRILRVDTAVPFLLGQVALLSRRSAADV